MESFKRAERRRLQKRVKDLFNDKSSDNLEEDLEFNQQDEIMDISSDTDLCEDLCEEILNFKFDNIDSPGVDSDESDEGFELVPNLASWATKYGPSRECVNDLLDILCKSGLNVPKDSRTLLKTPRIIDGVIEKPNKNNVIVIPLKRINCWGKCPFLICKVFRHFPDENFSQFKS